MSGTNIEARTSTDTRWSRWLETLGWKGRAVPIEHLPELRQEILGRLERGEIDEAFYRDQLGVFSFELPAELPDVRSMLVLAVPTPPMRVFFHRNGERIPGVLPPTYAHYNARTASVEGVVSRWLEREGHRGARAGLPLKTLAVRSGLAEQGRNNLCYVPGMGSFLQLVGLFTDMPCSGDPWRAARMLPRCDRCEICTNRCPTGAIDPQRFLLHAERCLTLRNENDGNLADGIDPSWHHCLFGCMRCQDRCPQDRTVAGWVDDLVEFTEEETSVLLQRAPSEKLDDPLAAKLESLGLSFDAALIGRNLEALLQATRARAR